MLHHPPIGIDSDFWRSVNLRDADALVAALPLTRAEAGGDVRVILCGHTHLQLSGRLAGVPVWTTPGVVTRIDLTAPPMLERAVVGASATLVDLHGPNAPLFSLLHARDPNAGRQVSLVDAASGADAPEE